MTKHREDPKGLEGLLPCMRPRVAGVLTRMRTLGFEPVFFDGLRTLEEAKRNLRRGSGIVLSMHLYGAAADIICDEHGWDCRKHGCKFYTKLGKCVGAEGLYWGDSFSDYAHMQGLPFTPAAQNPLRKMGALPATLGARDAYVASWLKSRA